MVKSVSRAYCITLVIDNWTIDGILKQPFEAEAVRVHGTLPIEISMVSLFITLTTLSSTLINIDV